MKNGEIFVFYKGTIKMLGAYKGLCSRCDAITYGDPYVGSSLLCDVPSAPAGYQLEEHAYYTEGYRGNPNNSICKKCVR